MPIILPETSIATGNWPLSKMTLLSKESHVHFHGCFSRHVAGDFPITPPLELTWRHRWTKSVSYRGPEWNGPGKLESARIIRTNPRLHQLHSPNWKTCKKHVTCVHHMHVHVCSIHVYVYVHILYIYIYWFTRLFFAAKFDAEYIAAVWLILAIRIDLQPRCLRLSNGLHTLAKHRRKWRWENKQLGLSNNGPIMG